MKLFNFVSFVFLKTIKINNNSKENNKQLTNLSFICYVNIINRNRADSSNFLFLRIAETHIRTETLSFPNLSKSQRHSSPSKKQIIIHSVNFPQSNRMFPKESNFPRKESNRSRLHVIMFSFVIVKETHNSTGAEAQ